MSENQENNKELIKEKKNKISNGYK